MAASLAVAGAACTRDAGPGDWPSTEPYQVTTDYLPAPATSKIDLLFMLDHSNSTAPQRWSLIQCFPNLAALLANHDLHIGIITSSMGAGSSTPPSCGTIGGDQGMLQNQTGGPACFHAGLVDPSARFLSYVPADDGGSPTVNFGGTLAEAFACHAAIRENGCGFEHQLASVRAALEGCDVPDGCTQPANEGFLRPDANLAIVVLTDEDDCSAPPDTTLFDPSQTRADSELGPLTSYRCFEFGNLCDGEDPGRTTGRREGCEPGNKDPDPLHQLTPVEDFAAFLQTLRPDPGSLYVAVIAAPPGPIAVGLDASGYPDLQPACIGGTGSADPTPRLAKFLRLLSRPRGRFFSTCRPDLSDVMEALGADLTATSTCLTGWLRNGIATAPEFDPECVVVDRVPRDDGSGLFEERLIPPCEPVLCAPGSIASCACAHEIPAGEPGCWYAWPDESCRLYSLAPPYAAEWQLRGSGLRLAVDRGTDSSDPLCTMPPAPAGTVTVIQCATCIARPEDGVFDCSAACAGYWPERCPVADAGTRP